MTSPSLPRAAADHGSVRRFLTDHLGGDVEMGPDLPQGAWSRAYAFRHRERDLVIRFNTDRHSLELDRMAERYRSENLPIPNVIEVGETEDGFFAISERVFGDFLDELSPESMRDTAASVLRMLDSLRMADTSDSTGWGPWTREGGGHYASWPDCLLGGI